MSMDLEKDLACLISAVDEIDDEQKEFIDKSKAKAVASSAENDTFSKEFANLTEKRHKVFNGSASTKNIFRGDEQRVWIDKSLAEWPENDYRILVRNLPLSATDDDMIQAFKHFKSLAKVKIVRDSSGRNKSYGFVSLLDMNDYIEAMKTMNRAFVGKKRVIGGK